MCGFHSFAAFLHQLGVSVFSSDIGRNKMSAFALLLPLEQERKECWEGAIPFLEYVQRAIVYGLRWSIPCLHSAYDVDAQWDNDEDNNDDVDNSTASRKAGLSKKASNLKQAAEGMVRTTDHSHFVQCRSSVDIGGTTVVAVASLSTCCS